MYFNTFGVGFIFGGGGGVGGLKSGVFCCLLVDGPITFKWGEGRGEPISGSLWYLVHLHTAISYHVIIHTSFYF